MLLQHDLLVSLQLGEIEVGARILEQTMPVDSLENGFKPPPSRRKNKIKSAPEALS